MYVSGRCYCGREHNINGRLVESWICYTCGRDIRPMVGERGPHRFKDCFDILMHCIDIDGKHLSVPFLIKSLFRNFKNEDNIPWYKKCIQYLFYSVYNSDDGWTIIPIPLPLFYFIKYRVFKLYGDYEEELMKRLL